MCYLWVSYTGSTLIKIWNQDQFLCISNVAKSLTLLFQVQILCWSPLQDAAVFKEGWKHISAHLSTKTLMCLQNNNLIQMTHFSPLLRKSMPTYSFVMFIAALTTNNFLWEFLVGGNLHQQIGQPYVVWLLKVMCENTVSLLRCVIWSRHLGQGSQPKPDIC